MSQHKMAARAPAHRRAVASHRKAASHREAASRRQAASHRAVATSRASQTRTPNRVRPSQVTTPIRVVRPSHPRSPRPVAISQASLPLVRLDLHVRAQGWDTPLCVVSTPANGSQAPEPVRLNSDLVSTQRTARRGRLLLFVLVVVASLWWASSAAASQGGYGPGITGPTGPANAPGGYSTIVATHTFATAGGVLAAHVAGGQAHLTVPRGAFGRSAQIEITTPALTGIQVALPALGFGDFSAVGGIGVKVYDTNGKPLTGNFVHPLTLTMTGTSIGVGDRLIKFASPSSATLEEAVFAPGSVTVTLLADPDFAILAPTAAAAAAAAAAPSASASSSASASAAPASSAAPTIVQGEQFVQPSSSSSSDGRIAIAAVVAFLIAVAFVVIRRRRSRPLAGAYGAVAAPARSFEPRHSAAKRSAQKNSLRPLEPKHARR